MSGISIIGSGNLAWHLARRLKESGAEINKVISRNRLSGEALADAVGSIFSTSSADADLNGSVFLCIPDSSIISVSAELPEIAGMVIHTSGSISIEDIHIKHQNRGVLWPLQTFSRQQVIDWTDIPLILEYKGKDQDQFITLAKQLSDNTVFLPGAQRNLLHICAVLVNNFSNALFTEAEALLQTEHLDFKLLLPLIKETVKKLDTLSPTEAQTGPAKRNDEMTIQKHLEILKDSDVSELYQMMTELIRRRF